MDHFQDIMQAEKDGCLLVLPQIKKYRTLYWMLRDEIVPVRFWGFRGGCVDKDGKYHVICEMRTKKDRVFREKYRRKITDYVSKAGDRRYFYADNIGKTIFFTRKEADNALKCREVSS